MKTIKTVIENKHLIKVLDLLDEVGALGNTVAIEDKKETNSFKKFFKDQYTLLVTTCTEQEKPCIVGKIFPVITLIGGICLA